MSSLKEIREKFGISQQEVAHWLGVSRSLAEHYEKGIRGLPTLALLQLAKLEMIIKEFEKDLNNESIYPKNEGNNNNNSREEKTNNTLAGDSSSALHPRLAYQQDKVERLQQQLSLLKSRHSVLQQQMMLIKKMMDNCDEHTREKEKLWLQMLYHGVCARLCRFDEAKQLPLKAKILHMKFKAEQMNKKEY